MHMQCSRRAARRENADLGHTATGQSDTCKIDPQIRPAPQIQPTLLLHHKCRWLLDNSRIANSRTGQLAVWTGKGYFAECGLRNAESCPGVICGKFDADLFLRNEG